MTLDGAPPDPAELFESLFETAPDATVVVDRRGIVVRVNAQLERLFGYTRAELIGQPVELLVPARLRAMHAERREGYVSDPRPRGMGSGLELFGVRKDGSEIPVEISLAAVGTGDPVLVAAAIRDTTERKRESAHRAALTAIVESSSDAIVGEALDGTITSWNPGATQLFGWAAVEVLGRSATILTPPERADEHRRVLASIVRGEHVPPFETIRVRKDGTRIPVSIASSPVRDGSGKLVGASKVARDIASVQEARARADDARDAAERWSRELEAFSYSVAHDLRAPLRSINGFSTALLEDLGPGLDATHQRYLERIAASAERMGEVIDALLGLARVTRTEARRTPVDLGALAEEIVDAMREQEPTREATLLVVGEVRAHADPALCRVLLDNLLANAWKFTAKRERATIRLGTRHVLGAPTVFYVTDDGVGFEPSHAERLFQPFQRLHDSKEFAGTGIGLATVRRIVERHGGRVWAEARPGEGATFSFTLASGREIRHEGG